MSRKKTPHPNPRTDGRPHPLPRGKRTQAHEEITALHQRIYQTNQARINNAVADYSPAFKRYEKIYKKHTSTYLNPVLPSELYGHLAEADIIICGDYHTLKQAQRSFLRCIEHLPTDRPTTLALEFIQGRYQKILDRYMADQISTKEFLDQIHYDTHWVFGGWENFHRILQFAKEKHFKVIAIDSPGQGSTGDSVRERDRYMARKIAKAYHKTPDHRFCVFVGELHTAPPHLPAAIMRELHPSIPHPNTVIIHQNAESIYSQLQLKGLEHDTEIVRISDHQYCLINTPPIVCQQSFLNWLEEDDESEDSIAPVENFHRYARLLASFLDLPLGKALEEIEIETVADLSFLERLKNRGDFTRKDLKWLQSQIIASESCYIPRARTVYLSNSSINHISEEAAHFLRHICSGCKEPRHLVDSFYARVLEEAVGFLGSKLINHKRKCPHIPFFQRQAHAKTLSTFEKNVATLVLRHDRLEKGVKVHHRKEIFECGPRLFNAITHSLGYMLGDRLYYGFVDGILSKSDIQDLFGVNLAPEGVALYHYLYLRTLTKGITLPKRGE